MKLILVVDDDRDIRATVALALEEDGYRVQQAANGREALARLAEMKRDEPSLVLLDMMMPEMTGGEMLKVLGAKRLESLPVVVFSSHAHEAKGLGARRLLRKPVTLGVLLAVVHEICGATSGLV